MAKLKEKIQMGKESRLLAEKSIVSKLFKINILMF